MTAASRQITVAVAWACSGMSWGREVAGAKVFRDRGINHGLETAWVT